MKTAVEVVSEINSMFRLMSWCDIELFEFAKNRLVLTGSLSTSYPYDIRIIFDDVFYMQSNVTWKTDTSKDVVFVETGDIARRLVQEYEIEDGYHIFRIAIEDAQGDGFVVAKSINYETNNDLIFGGSKS